MTLKHHARLNMIHTLIQNIIIRLLNKYTSIGITIVISEASKLYHKDFINNFSLLDKVCTIITFIIGIWLILHYTKVQTNNNNSNVDKTTHIPYDCNLLNKEASNIHVTEDSSRNNSSITVISYNKNKSRKAIRRQQTICISMLKKHSYIDE